MTDGWLEMLAALSRAQVDKVAKELPRQPIMTATLLSVDATIDAYPHARVHVDGNPAHQTDVMPIATGGNMSPGQRVIVLYSDPAGAWVIGPASGNVTGRCDVSCGFGGGNIGTVELDLPTPSRVAIDIVTDQGLAGWTIDGTDVESPVGEFGVSTIATLSAGAHTIEATSVSSKSDGCIQVRAIVLGPDDGSTSCVEFAAPPELCLNISDNFVLQASDNLSTASGTSGVIDVELTCDCTTFNLGGQLQDTSPYDGTYTLQLGLQVLSGPGGASLGSITNSGPATGAVFVNFGGTWPAGSYTVEIDGVLTPHFFDAIDFPSRTVNWNLTASP